MKQLFICLLLLSVTATIALCQSPVKVTIRLKDGKTIEAHHFGKLVCESNRTAYNFTILRGKFHDTHTEISDYKDISKLLFTGFTAAPAPSVGNQKGNITAVKKSGISVELDNAELVMSCFSPADRYNEIHVQVINPLTDEKTDVAVEMRKIESITF
jgi:hypothetical protein